MSDLEKAPCSLVYPPECDAMTADEQMLWFLAQLSAQMDSIKAEFAVARAGDPVGATSQVDLPAFPPPATATSSHRPRIHDYFTHHRRGGPRHFPESSLDSNRHIPDTGMDEHTWVEAAAAPGILYAPGRPRQPSEHCSYSAAL
ncbi:hypothetical protein VPH35_052195 [Triticum aestivum]